MFSIEHMIWGVKIQELVWPSITREHPCSNSFPKKTNFHLWVKKLKIPRFGGKNPRTARFSNSVWPWSGPRFENFCWPRSGLRFQFLIQFQSVDPWVLIVAPKKFLFDKLADRNIFRQFNFPSSCLISTKICVSNPKMSHFPHESSLWRHSIIPFYSSLIFSS